MHPRAEIALLKKYCEGNRQENLLDAALGIDELLRISTVASPGIDLASTIVERHFSEHAPQPVDLAGGSAIVESVACWANDPNSDGSQRRAMAVFNTMLHMARSTGNISLQNIGKIVSLLRMVSV